MNIYQIITSIFTGMNVAFFIFYLFKLKESRERGKRIDQMAKEIRVDSIAALLLMKSVFAQKVYIVWIAFEDTTACYRTREAAEEFLGDKQGSVTELDIL